jgi:hypothetical protein
LRRPKALSALSTNALESIRRTRPRLKNFLVAGRFVLSGRGEVLVFVAHEEDLTEVLFLMGFDHGHTIQNGPFEIELHHDAEGLRETGTHSDREIQAADLPAFYEPTE